MEEASQPETSLGYQVAQPKKVGETSTCLVYPSSIATPPPEKG